MFKPCLKYVQIFLENIGKSQFLSEAASNVYCCLVRVFSSNWAAQKILHGVVLQIGLHRKLLHRVVLQIGLHRKLLHRVVLQIELHQENYCTEFFFNLGAACNRKLLHRVFLQIGLHQENYCTDFFLKLGQTVAALN